MRFLADVTRDVPRLGSTWAVVRTAIAAAPLLTLLTNTPQTIFPSSRSLIEQGRCDGAAGMLLACVVDGGDYGWIAHLILILLFAAVASGILPVIAGPMHVYAAISYMNVIGTMDGGDHAALAFSVWALPICLVDLRLTHWHRPGGKAERQTTWTMLRSSTIAVFLFVSKLQVAFIYLQACVSKLAVAEWADGTSFYYWTVDGYLPPPSIFAPLVDWMSSVSVFVLVATYGTLVLEFALGISLLIKNVHARKVLWVTALTFHFMIGVVFGIWSFALVMMALATLLLSPRTLSEWWGTRKPQETPVAHERVGVEQ